MDYITTNKALWDARVAHHAASDFYDVSGFLAGANTLTEIELPLLGNVSNKHVVHLQCHFGLDTLSIARMGARVTGIDFSAEAIHKARELATKAGLKASFIQSDVYEASTKLAEKADTVFTTFGVLGWLPDMQRWAATVADCLKPGGELVLAEFHPVIWMFDNNIEQVAYSYFMRDPIIEQEEGTYTDAGAPISLPSVGWNHSIGEVYTALRDAGMNITFLQEYDFSPYPALAGSVPVGEKRWAIKGKEGMLPLVYALKAIKES